MNTSDQNVFTLDTAFQRRWEMRLIENNFEHVDSRLANAEILDTGITWEVFCTQINKIIVGNNARMASAEDKRLGAYFVHLRDLMYNPKMGDLSTGEYDDLRTKEQNKSITPSEETRLAEIRGAMKQNRKFPEKVIKYLWDDAFKFNREIVFETTTYQSLEQVIRTFMYSEKLDRLAMFKDNVRNAFTNPEE
jgi:5-methylcytosine-specific restriction endonuclease McrBC GTP-binding regulatory subunit McrB